MLEKIELFKSLTSQELEEIEKILQTVSLSRGDFVFKQGDLSRDFYIIKTGIVELSIKDIFRENKTIGVLNNGAFFGEMALFDKNLARSLDARILQNAVLIKIPGEEFERLLLEKPSISFKIMGAMSRRLKEANEQRGPAVGSTEGKSEGKIIVIASPRNGYGKTTLSTTLAHLLSNELGKRILYIDLDLYFGDGTFALGVFSPKSILVFAERFKEEPPTWEVFLKYLVRHNENLYILPAPKDFIEGEKVKESDFGSILKTSRGFFDYIIIDTDSSVNEVFLTAIDQADQVLFLVNVRCAMSIKSDVRYFRGISHLSLPQERCALLATKAGGNFDPVEMGKLLSFKVIGVLPEIKSILMEYGQSVYQLAPKGPYCEALRVIFKSLFKDTWLPGHTESGFFYRLFFPGEPNQKSEGGGSRGVSRRASSLEIPDVNSTTLLTFIRSLMGQGYWDKAFAEAMDLLETFPNSPAILQVLGEVSFCQKNFQLGIDALQKALNLDPENHYAMGILGTIQLNEAMKTRAMDMLMKKIEKNPGFPDLHNDRGKLAFSFKDFNAAEKAFQRALELNPEFDEARVNLAINYAEVLDFPTAIEQLLKVKKKNIRISYLLGCYLFNTGDLLASFTAFSKVTEENPRYLEVGEKVEALRSYFRKLTNLLKVHQEKARMYPDFPDLHCTIGNLLTLLGRTEEARREFQSALVLNPHFLEASEKLEALGTRTHPPLETPLPGLPSDEGLDKFTVVLEVENPSPEAIHPLGNLPNFLVSLKNIRTNKTVAAEVPPADFQENRISFDCLTIGPILAEDILLVQLMDDRSRTVFATLVHIVSDGEVRERKVKLDLASLAVPSWNYHFGSQNVVRLPVHHFAVRIISPQLRSLVVGDDPPVRAEIRNLKTGIVAQGQGSPANPGETYFVLASDTGAEVAGEGDLLHFLLTDRQGRTVFSMDFPVLAGDIEEFCKTVSVEMLEQVLHATKPQIPDAAKTV